MCLQIVNRFDMIFLRVFVKNTRSKLLKIVIYYKLHYSLNELLFLIKKKFFKNFSIVKTFSQINLLFIT